MASFSHERQILELALARGLVSREEISVVEQATEYAQTVSPNAIRWGAVVDQLVATGQLTEETVAELARSLGSPLPSSLPAQPITQSGSFVDARRSDTFPTDDKSVAEPFPVQQWNRYQFIRMLGQGGMGAVYEATDLRLKRKVALKFIRGQDPEMLQRFLQEARAQAKIDHHGICKVFEVGEVQAKPYIAMQYVDGRPLDQVAKDLSLPQKVLLIKEAAGALHEAHRLGILHRDVKPSNIMVVRDESGSPHPVIMDFGLAREGQEGAGLTETGAVMGTPAYMAPEQARGDTRQVDRRSDIYSLGATLYELLCGAPPFVAGSVVALLLKVTNEDAPQLRTRCSGVSADLETITMKCLSRESARRYDSARELAEDLQRYIDGEPIHGRAESAFSRWRRQARRNRPLTASLVVAVLAVLIGSSYGFFVQHRAEQQKRKAAVETALTEQVSREMKDMEWVMRTAYTLPLHNVQQEVTMVRQRMTVLETQMSRYGEQGRPLAHYGLGRGYMALHEYENAKGHLLEAIARSPNIPGAYYALGRTMVELYRIAIEEARRTGNLGWVEKRKGELGQTLLAPALAYLDKSRQQIDTESPSYVDALIAFYRQQEDGALSAAQKAVDTLPWMYEARKLQGDVYLERAIRAKDRGARDEANKAFQDAITAYEKAAEIGRSDAEVFDGLAEVWIRRMEMDGRHGLETSEMFKNAILYCDKSITSSPSRSNPHTKKAFAHFFAPQNSFRDEGSSDIHITEIETHSKRAIELNPRDYHAYEMLAAAYQMHAEQPLRNSFTKADSLALLKMAQSALERSIQINPQFVWGFNDLGNVHKRIGNVQHHTGINPMESYNLAIDLYQKAATLDDKYVYPHGNSSWTYFHIASYLIDNGLNSEDEIKKATEHAKLCYLMGGGVSLCTSAIIAANSLGAAAAFEAGRPIDNFYVNIDQATVEFVKHNATIDLPFLEYRAMGEIVIGLMKIQNGESPTTSLQSADKLLQQCLEKAPTYWWCWALQTRRLLAVALWEEKQGKLDISENRYLQTVKKAQETVSINSAEAEPYNLLAETYLRLAEVSLRRKRRAAESLKNGLSATTASLAIRSNLGLTHALKGALLTVSARVESIPQSRQTLAAEASQELDLALKQNKLLSRDYSKYRTEALLLQGH